MGTPKISVIIPCYNAEGTIGYALKSLQNQSYRDFEVIIVDDGSTDDTVQSIEKNKGQLQVHVFHQTNNGVSFARNLALEHSSGEYITFLDADDLYHPDFLKIMISEMKKNDCDMVISKYHMTSKILTEFEKQEYTRKELTKYQTFELYNNHRNEKVNFVNCIYRKEVIEKNEICFPTMYKYGEDAVFFLRYLAACQKKVIVTDAVLYEYVIRKESASHVRNYERVQVIEAFKYIAAFWCADPLFDKSIAEYAIDRAIWAQCKDFAYSGVLLDRLSLDYDVKSAMRNMSVNCEEFVVRVTAKMYLINKRVFAFVCLLYRVKQLLFGK